MPAERPRREDAPDGPASGASPRRHPRRGRRGRGAWLWGLGGAGACAVAAAAVLLIIAGWGYTPGPAPTPPATFSLAPSNVPNPATGPAPTIGQPPDGPAHTAAAPTARRQVPKHALRNNTLVIPALGVDAPVGSSGITNGELVLPSDVARTTEWDGSAPIGGHTGTILIAGHVNNVNQGEGALWQLHLIQSGDAVYLAKDGVVTRWKITGVTAVHKSALPHNLFIGNRGPRLLKLVTCGGRLEHTPSGLGYYQDNVIATAVPF